MNSDPDHGSDQTVSERRNRRRVRRALFSLYAGLVLAITIVALAQYMRLDGVTDDQANSAGSASRTGSIEIPATFLSGSSNVTSTLAAISPAAGKPGPWRLNAVTFDGSDATGHLVIVIDDMGHDARRTRRFAALPGPMTFALLPYAAGVSEQANLLRANGHELLVHLPMEPVSAANPGPNALGTAQSPGEVLERLDWNLRQFKGYVGVNNHMGSRYTENYEMTAAIMGELDRRGLLFLDSLTSANSSAGTIARDMGMPWANRDVFIDNDRDADMIRAQLLRAAELAMRNGVAISIGHPYEATYEALQTTLPEIERMGIRLAPVSVAVRIGRERVWAVTQTSAGGARD